MKIKFSKNSIISFILIASTILMPLSVIPKKADAQSVSGYVTGIGIAAEVYSLPQCAGQINSAVSGLFDGIGGLFGSSYNGNNAAAQSQLGGYDYQGAFNSMEQGNANKDVAAAQQQAGQDLNTAAQTAANELGIQVNDTNSQNLLEKIAGSAQATQASTASMNANSTCIQSIGRLMIKTLLQKLTVSTVNWINSGFNGSPAFVQDPSKFFNDMAKNEILQFGVEINNPTLFPFGKAWLQNTAAAFNNKFQNNAQYSLNQLISATNPDCRDKNGNQVSCDVAFSQDFSQGGWNAWTAMTQVPANNPMGFQLMADNELQQRLAGTVQSEAQNTRDALQAANGFLSDTRCVDPAGVTQQQKTAALAAGKKDPCNEWEVLTPGKAVADAATNVMGYQNNVYLNVQDLNDAVAAIADALLGQFSSNIMEKGFSNMSTQGADGTLEETGLGSGATTTQTQQDFTPAQLTSSWLAANPNFNIRTDLTQALIDDQRTYVDKLTNQDKELMSTTDGNPYSLNKTTGLSNAYGLIPAIYQLDYCIPGPHPGWQQDSQNTLNAVTNLLVPQTEDSLKSANGDAIAGVVTTLSPLVGAAIGAAIGSAVPVVGTIIGAAVGAAVSLITSLLSSSDDYEKVRLYYASQVEALTGMLPDYTNDHDTTTPNIISEEGVINGLNTILNRYDDIMNETYFSSPNILPPVASEAATDFNQLTGYAQMIKNNQTEISSMNNTIGTLTDIKKDVDALNAEYPSGGSDYENALQSQINAFANVSASMVNGDDIASADSLLQQIITEKNHIYNDLLKGPYGCEAWLENPANITKFPSSGGGSWPSRDWSNFDVNSVKRMTYPFPIFYDYNVLAKGTNIPDPWSSGYTNTMPVDNMYDTYGPGFLSFVFFSTGYVVSDLNYTDVRGNDRLKFAEDVFGTSTDGLYRYVSVGQRIAIGCGITNVDVKNCTSAFHGGPFETIIGIY